MNSPDFQRTDWFDPDAKPEIAGPYECSISPGHNHIFRRVWTGEAWLSPVTNIPSSVRLHWRGVVPGSIERSMYAPAVRNLLPL